MSTDKVYHVPVMLHPCLDALQINPNGVYVDVTFGGGGHSSAILNRLEGGKLYAFDKDQAAKANAEGLDKSKFTLIQADFRHIQRYLKLYGVQQVDGILADLGVSSHQIDEPERGFSTRFEGELDMRMDRTTGITAKTIVNDYSEEQLHKIFGMYGEVKNAKTLAQTIHVARLRQPIETVNQLKQAIANLMPRGRENKYLAQVFQALRIEVNEELPAIEALLTQSADLLKPGGRLVVMSYHSLEDRLVKNFMNKGKFFGDVEKDLFGNEIKPLRQLTRKPIEATAEEIDQNRRARSAKLRIAEKT